MTLARVCMYGQFGVNSQQRLIKSHFTCFVCDMHKFYLQLECVGAIRGLIDVVCIRNATVLTESLHVKQIFITWKNAAFDLLRCT